MKILFYNPDNEVTYNFMPHLWMFLLKAVTPPGHEVLLVDGNARRMHEQELVAFIRQQKVELVGIGAMTRMVAKAYRVAEGVRAAGIPVVMGGPHVTELPEEALGRNGGPRYADAVALGEADQTWPQIVADTERGELKEIYAPVDASGKEIKPSLNPYPEIPWEKMDLEQFNLVNLVPRFLKSVIWRAGMKGGKWQSFHIVPVETGRGCPYGCEFCTVTGFFGDSLRFRSNQSVVGEMLRLKALAAKRRGKIAVFFIDDNFAINRNRTKSLLREIIAQKAQLPWIAQISLNLLQDEELVFLIAQSGGKYIFIGVESIDDENLKIANKGFSKPRHQKEVLERLARHNLYAITSFIFGMDNDSPGVARRTIATIKSWPPCLPVFSQLTPYPATPLYNRLAETDRLVRPRHWLDFQPFQMAFDPLGISAGQVGKELREAWQEAYAPATTRSCVNRLKSRPIGDRALHFVARLVFRGIYFPQMRKRDWARLLFANRNTIVQLLLQALTDSKIKGLPETLPQFHEQREQISEP